MTLKAVPVGLAALIGLMLLSSGAVAAPQITPLPNPLALLERYQPQPATPQSTAQAGQTWTVLVYLHADNSLFVSALQDLLEMEQVGSSDGVRFVVQMDAPSPGSENTEAVLTNKQVVTFKSFDGGLRALVPYAPASSTSNELALLDTAIGKLSVIERIPEPDSDDPKVLAEFINWGVKRFPAQHYGVILWDHGGAWELGYGQDDSNGRHHMPAWGVREGLKAGMAQSGLQHMDFLSFDACLMGGTELLFEYGDLTDVYIANPETDFGAGWDYTGAFKALRDNPRISTRDFATQEVRYYQAHHRDSPDDVSYHAHSAYDMAQLENLKIAINGFVNAATRSADRAALLTARSSVTGYDLDTEQPNVPTPYVDLGQYGSLVANATKDAALAQAGRTLSLAVNQIVIAKTLGDRINGALGLAVWLPNNPNQKPSNQQLGNYSSRLRMASGVHWKTFIDLWFGNIAPSVQSSNQGVDVRLTRKVNLRDPSVRNPAVISFDVTGNVNLVYGELGEAVGRNGFNVYGHLYLQSGGAGQYEYPWDGQWFDVDGSNGSSDYFTGFYRQAGDNSIFANAVYTPPGRTQGFAVIVVGDLSTARLTNVLDNSSIAPRDITLRSGGTLRFQFLQRDLLTGDTVLAPTGRSVTVPEAGLESMRLERKRMPLGEYQLIFGARDAAGSIRSGNAPVQIR